MTPRLCFTSVTLTLLLGSKPALAGPSIDIPLKLHDRSAFLTATVDGIELPLILDTGDSSNLVLAKSVLDRLNAMPVRGTWNGHDMHGKVQTVEYRISRLRIGDALFTDVIARQEAHSVGNQPRDHVHKGYLGTGLLKGYRVVIDFSQRRMTLVEPTGDRLQTQKCRGAVAPFISSRFPDEPVTAASTDLGNVVLWWDSGAQMTGVARRVVEKAGRRTTDGLVTVKSLRFGDDEFGPWAFDAMDAALPPFFDGFIGFDFFSKHVVCLDFPGRRVFIRADSAESANQRVDTIPSPPSRP